MFGKKNEKLETLKELLGSREAYMESVQMLELEGEEKEIFLRASVELKKKKPNPEIIDKAYDILVSKSFQEEDTDNATEAVSESNFNSIPYPDAKSSARNWKKFTKLIIIFFTILLALVLAYKLVPIVNNINIVPTETVLFDKTVKRTGLRYKVNSQEPFTGIVESYYKDGQKEYAKNYKNGVSDGKVIEYYKSGQKKYEGSIKNDKPNGKIITWYDNGQKEYEKYYKNGGLDGSIVKWKKDGQKEYEKNYKNGVLHGKVIQWSKNGTQSFESHIVNGADSGKYIKSYYFSSGQKKIQIGHKKLPNGKTPEWYEVDTSKDGKVVEWYENGKKKFEGNYKNGKPHGKFIAWDEHGETIAEADADVNIFGRSVLDFHSDGTIQNIANTKNNQANGNFFRWHANGQIAYKGNVKNGIFDGKLIGWDENGQKRSEIYYVKNSKGDLEGKFIEWYENGQKAGEGTIVNDKKEGKVIEWYENGQKKREENYINGTLEGKAFKWHEDGKQVYEKTYKNGVSLKEIKEREEKLKAQKIREHAKKIKALERANEREALRKKKVQDEKLRIQREKDERLRIQQQEEALQKKKEEEERLRIQQKQEAIDKGCYYLDGTLNIGTIEGYVTTNFRGYDFILDKKYYVETPSRHSSFSKEQKLSLVVKKTRRTREVSLLDLHPYETKQGESEYSKRAINHKRRYPSNKFKTLEVLSLVGTWSEVCQ